MLVPLTVAAVLEAREGGDQPVLDVLKGYLRAKRLLLVLDNFEHVLDAAPLVSELLAACPGLTVLVTSRALLHVRGEREYPVSPLPAPPIAGDNGAGRQSAAELARYPAVALFVERAAGVKAGFMLTDANGSTVAAICARLDGLPLALELAAMRIKLLPPPALLARLSDRLALLTGGPRDLPARQQTLRAAITWSHDLLTESEQALFRRLAVFAGGCTLEAAEALAGGQGEGTGGQANDFFLSPCPPVPLSPSVLDGLGALVDANLVQQIEAVDGEPRFLMLETIREYGLEQLAGSGEEAAVRQRHAAWFLAVAEDFFTVEQREGSLAPLFRVERDLANFRVALAWAEETGDTETGLRLAAALVSIWELRSLRTEGRGWLERALSRDSGAPTRARAAALATLGTLEGEGMADPRPALAHVEEGIALARALGDQRTVAIALEWAGSIALSMGEDDRAEAMLKEAERRSDEIGYRQTVAYVRLRLGGLARRRGDLDLAVAHYGDALTLLREMEDSFGVAMALQALGRVLTARGDYGGAAAGLREALSGWREAGTKDEFVDWLAQAAFLAAAVGEWERSARWFGTVEVQYALIRFAFSPMGKARLESIERDVRSGLGDAAFAAAQAAGRVLSLEQAITEAAALLDTLAARDDAN